MKKKIEKALGQALSLVEKAREIVEPLLEEERRIYDSRSFEWQDSENGEETLEGIDALDMALDVLNDATSQIEESI